MGRVSSLDISLVRWFLFVINVCPVGNLISLSWYDTIPTILFICQFLAIFLHIMYAYLCVNLRPIFSEINIYLFQISWLCCFLLFWFAAKYKWE